MKELINVQSALKAPKDQYNSFGKYKYRNTEGILEAVKPLLLGEKCLLTITDEIVSVEGRHYVKATATITNEEGKTVSVSAFARETENKAGMDAAQITGAASSYARKYALNGLFCIDDTKDTDETNNGDKTVPSGKTGNAQAIDLSCLDIALQSVKEAANKEELTKVWRDWQIYQGVEQFKTAVATRGKDFNNKKA